MQVDAHLMGEVIFHKSVQLQKDSLFWQIKRDFPPVVSTTQQDGSSEGEASEGNRDILSVCRQI